MSGDDVFSREAISEALDRWIAESRGDDRDKFWVHLEAAQDEFGRSDYLSSRTE